MYTEERVVELENKRVALRKITDRIMEGIACENSTAMRDIIEKLAWPKILKMKAGCLVENTHAWDRYDLA
jgi:hypothetical protein